MSVRANSDPAAEAPIIKWTVGSVVRRLADVGVDALK